MQLRLVVLAIAIILEFTVLYKAGKEILHEVGIKGTVLSPLTTSFTHLNRAKPATKLVFMEDLVATSGGILAFVAVLISHFTGFLQAEGIASIMIGIMMFYVVGKVFLIMHEVLLEKQMNKCLFILLILCLKIHM